MSVCRSKKEAIIQWYNSLVPAENGVVDLHSFADGKAFVKLIKLLRPAVGISASTSEVENDQSQRKRECAASGSEKEDVAKSYKAVKKFIEEYYKHDLHLIKIDHCIAGSEVELCKVAVMLLCALVEKYLVEGDATLNTTNYLSVRYQEEIMECMTLFLEKRHSGPVKKAEFESMLNKAYKGDRSHYRRSFIEDSSLSRRTAVFKTPDNTPDSGKKNVSKRPAPRHHEDVDNSPVQDYLRSPQVQKNLHIVKKDLEIRRLISKLNEADNKNFELHFKITEHNEELNKQKREMEKLKLDHRKYRESVEEVESCRANALRVVEENKRKEINSLNSEVKYLKLENEEQQKIISDLEERLAGKQKLAIQVDVHEMQKDTVAFEHSLTEKNNQIQSLLDTNATLMEDAEKYKQMWEELKTSGCVNPFDSSDVAESKAAADICIAESLKSLEECKRERDDLIVRNELLNNRICRHENKNKSVSTSQTGCLDACSQTVDLPVQQSDIAKLKKQLVELKEQLKIANEKFNNSAFMFTLSTEKPSSLLTQLRDIINNQNSSSALLNEALLSFESKLDEADNVASVLQCKADNMDTLLQNERTKLENKLTEATNLNNNYVQLLSESNYKLKTVEDAYNDLLTEKNVIIERCEYLELEIAKAKDILKHFTSKKKAYAITQTELLPELIQETGKSDLLKLENEKNQLVQALHEKELELKRAENIRSKALQELILCKNKCTQLESKENLRKVALETSTPVHKCDAAVNTEPQQLLLDLNKKYIQSTRQLTDIENEMVKETCEMNAKLLRTEEDKLRLSLQCSQYEYNNSNDLDKTSRNSLQSPVSSLRSYTDAGLHEIIVQLNQKIANTTGKLNQAEAEKVHLDQVLDELQSKLKTVEENYGKLLDEKIALDNKCIQYKKKYEDAKSTSISVQTEKNASYILELEKVLEEIKFENKDSQGIDKIKIVQDKDLFKDFLRKLNDLRKEEKMLEWSLKINKGKKQLLEKEIETLKSSKNLLESDIEKKENKLKETKQGENKKLKELEKNMEKSAKSYKKITSEKGKELEEIKQTSKLAHDHKGIEELEKQLKDAAKANTLIVLQKEKRIKQLEKENERITKSISEHEKRYEELEKKIEEITIEKDLCKKESDKILAEKHDIVSKYEILLEDGKQNGMKYNFQVLQFNTLMKEFVTVKGELEKLKETQVSTGSTSEINTKNVSEKEQGGKTSQNTGLGSLWANAENSDDSHTHASNESLHHCVKSENSKEIVPQSENSKEVVPQSENSKEVVPETESQEMELLQKFLSLRKKFERMTTSVEKLKADKAILKNDCEKMRHQASLKNKEILTCEQVVKAKVYEIGRLNKRMELYQNELKKLKLEMRNKDEYFRRKFEIKANASQAKGIKTSLTSKRASTFPCGDEKSKLRKSSNSSQSSASKTRKDVFNESFNKSIRDGHLSGLFQAEDEESFMFGATKIPDEMPSENRLAEIQRRNTLCPPHLQSSYPLEIQGMTPSERKYYIGQTNGECHPFSEDTVDDLFPVKRRKLLADDSFSSTGSVASISSTKKTSMFPRLTPIKNRVLSSTKSFKTPSSIRRLMGIAQVTKSHSQSIELSPKPKSTSGFAGLFQGPKSHGRSMGLSSKPKSH